MNLLMTAFCVLLQSSISPASSDESNLEKALFELPDVAFEKISKPCDIKLRYRLWIRQPLDHQDPSRGYFHQRVELTHHGFDRPTIMETQGYDLNYEKNELEAALNANYLNIEHRYFGESSPDSLAWQYLTLEQVAADLHHINQLFRQIYKTKWLSTGISKGGQTTIFYKYFYPNDVDVSIPYVAPFNHGLEDKRIYAFLDTVGSAVCRKAILEFQTYMLKNEDKAVEKLTWYAKGADMTFGYLDNSIGKAYELAILEFSFAFWQWGAKCDEIPVNQNLDSCLSYFLRVSGIDLFADKGMKQYQSHYYQASTQMGYYGYNIEPFKKYIRHFQKNPSASFPPKEAGILTYDNSLNERVEQWLKEMGNHMIYIYGGSDTWSADRITPSDRVNSRAFVLPGKDHGRARVKNMDKAMQDEFAQLLGQWLKVDVNIGAIE